MHPTRFANLHAHTTYSMLDGYGTPEQIAERLTHLGQTACAITDHGNCYGHIPYQSAMQTADIHPVFGCEFYIVDDSSQSSSKFIKSLGVNGFPHITVIARTQAGYRNFLKLMEESYKRFYYKPRIDLELLCKYQEGLIVLTGCPTGFPTRYIEAGKIDEAHAFIKTIRDRCERSYVEMVMQPGYPPSEIACMPLIDIAEDLGMQVVATGDSHFPRPEDHKYQDLLLHITFKVPVGQVKPVTLPPYQYYSSALRMYERGIEMFDNATEIHGYRPVESEWLCKAIELSDDIAHECQVEISKAKSIAFPKPVGVTSDAMLREWMLEGLAMRKNTGKIPEGMEDAYLERAEREFDVISRKGFSDYMLAVGDVCRWAKAQDTLVMCRGSAGGSVLLWAIDASETDPIAHDLSFERFYDDTRPDPPDVDMDFETWVRPKIIEYIFQKYGHEHCAQILALSLMRAKVAVVDTAQAYCIPKSEYAALSLALDSKDDDFDGQLEDLTDPAIMDVVRKHPRLRDAGGLMGQVRQGTIHAAGVIVSAEPLHELIAVLEQPGKPPVSSVDKHAAAKLGFLKFDFLSVSAFDVLANACRKVGIKMADLYALDFDDPKVYETAKRGEVVGVFQLDGAALKVGEQIGLDKFEELYAASALCRPGAMEFVPLYKKNKEQNDAFEAYIANMDPRAAAIVRPTYGVVLYQEQMMAMARQLAGFDWPKVHKLRKRVAAASFNGHALGAEFEDPFMDGCEKNGIPRKEADAWWSAIKQHGIYSFNKSHCVTYAIVSYWMLWVKTYYPDAYYEAYLAQEGQNGKNPLLMKRLIIEWKKKGGKMQVFSRKRPTVHFTSPEPGLLCGGWADISGIGEVTAQKIIDNGPYGSWAEVATMVPTRVYGEIVETGMTGEMTDNIGKLLHLAPWFPVGKTTPDIIREVEPYRISHAIHTPAELPIGEQKFSVKVSGYVSTRFKKPRTGSFKGEQLIYTIEDETGIVSARVSTRNKDMQIKVKDAWEVGDYVVAQGWWSGDGTLFISEFIMVKKWNAVI